MKKKIVIIGLGSMGKRRIRLLKQMYPDNEYIGIDSNPERIGDVQRQFAVRTADSLDEIESDIYAAFVCTSPKSHAGLIDTCLRRGMHVFTEINLILDGYDENMKLAGEAGKTLFLSSTQLYKAEIRHIARRVQSSSCRKLYTYHVGQYLPDWHPWDTLQEFFVSDKDTNGCRELMAIEFPWLLQTFGRVDNVSVYSRNLTELPLSFPDTYAIDLYHADGTLGRLLIDVTSRQAVRHFEVIGEDIYMTWDGTPDSLYEKDINLQELKQIDAGEYMHREGYGSFINEVAYMEEIREFFDVIQGKQAKYTFEKDKETLALIDRIEKRV